MSNETMVVNEPVDENLPFSKAEFIMVPHVEAACPLKFEDQDCVQRIRVAFVPQTWELWNNCQDFVITCPKCKGKFRTRKSRIMEKIKNNVRVTL